MASLNTIFDKPITIQLLRERMQLNKESEESMILKIMEANVVDLSCANLTSINGLDVCSDLIFINLSCN